MSEILVPDTSPDIWFPYIWFLGHFGRAVTRSSQIILNLGHFGTGILVVMVSLGETQFILENSRLENSRVIRSRFSICQYSKKFNVIYVEFFRVLTNTKSWPYEYLCESDKSLSIYHWNQLTTHFYNSSHHLYFVDKV